MLPRAELRRRRLLSFLRDDKPVWNDEDHPELDRGTKAWVKEIRREKEPPVSDFRATPTAKQSR